MHGRGRGCTWQVGACMARGTMSGGGGAFVVGGMHAGDMATEVGSTQPTGIHSCFLYVCFLLLYISNN